MIVSVTCVDCGGVREVVVRSGWPSPRCDSCRSLHLRAYEAKRHTKRRVDPGYKANAAERTNRWRSENPDRHKENVRRWAAENRERKKELLRRWITENLERNKETKRRWRAENPEIVREMSRRWKSENLDKLRIYSQRRRALKVAAAGDFTTEEFVSICEAYDNCCAYCGCEGKMTADHVIPLSRGGSNDIENIVPACLSCNSRKGARTGDEFMAAAA